MAAQQGREALAAGALDEAAAALSEALGWWRGPALQGADDDGVLFREAARLEELRWGVLEDRIDADLQTGADAQLVPELEQLVGDAPLRERLHGFLMLALYRAGRQAEALHARTSTPVRCSARSSASTPAQSCRPWRQPSSPTIPPSRRCGATRSCQRGGVRTSTLRSAASSGATAISRPSASWSTAIAW